MNTIVYVIIGLITITYFIYMYIEGSKGKKYQKFYDFIQHPNLYNFRLWYAEVANDVWGNIISTLVFSALPLPYLSGVRGFIDRFLVSLGLTYLTNVVIAGRPLYDASRKRTTVEQLLALIIGTFIFIPIGFRTVSQLFQ